MVHSLPAGGRDDLNGGEFDNLCSEFFEPGRKFTRLLPGTGDEDFFAFQRYPIQSECLSIQFLVTSQIPITKFQAPNKFQ
jgi:hypothetical protein